MSNKGKNFTAAQKHFEQKETAYRKQIKELETVKLALAKSLAESENKRHALETENAMLKDHNERLLEYANMTPQEIEAACKRDKSLNALAGLIGMTSMFGGYVR